MGAESELIQKRQEVRDEILALKETIPSARILNRLGSMFKQNSWRYWLSSIVLLHLILLSPWAIIGMVLQEFEKPTIVFVEGLLSAEMIVLGFVVGHAVVRFIIDDIANRIVEKIDNSSDLAKLLTWLRQTWSMQNVFSFAFLLCLMWVSVIIGGISLSAHQFVGLGLSITTVFVGFLAGIVIYIYVWMCLLISNLKLYQYEMNAFSPADSEIINDISEILTKVIYILAAYGALVTLVISSSLIDRVARVLVGIPVLGIGWIIIIAQFLLTRSTLGKITNRAKWMTLNRIREKINTLEATGDLSDKDTAERLFRLADIHKQIMASKTNTLDLKSVSTLFSQLMLPLLGLLLGNLDKLSILLP